MIIGDPREDDKLKKISGHEIVLEKFADGQENIKITIMSSGLRSKQKLPLESEKEILLQLSKALNNKNSKEIPLHTYKTKAIKGWNLERQQDKKLQQRDAITINFGLTYEQVYQAKGQFGESGHKKRSLVTSKICLRRNKFLLHLLEGIEQASIIIGSMEVSINEIKEPIVIGN
jgi:hypothetical protein